MLYPEDIEIKNDEGYNALLLAATNSNMYSTEETVKILFEYGADVNSQTYNGYTALMNAVKNINGYSTVKTVEMLLEHDANINMQTNYGSTVLMMLVRYTDKCISIEILKLLLKYNTNVNVKNDGGYTALLHASRWLVNDFTDVSKILIDHGVDVNIQNKYGKTAIMFAVKRLLSNESVKNLMDAGASIYIKDHKNQDVIDIAFKKILVTSRNHLNNGKCVLDILLPNRKNMLNRLIANGKVTLSKESLFQKMGLCDFKNYNVIVSSFKNIIMRM